MHVSDGYIPVVSNKALTKTSKIVHIPDTKVIRVYVYTLNSKCPQRHSWLSEIRVHRMHTVYNVQTGMDQTSSFGSLLAV